MGIPKSVEQAREYSNNINNVDATLMPQNEQNLVIRYALHDIAKQTGEAPAFNFDYSPVDYDDTLSSEIYKPYVNPLQDAFGMLWNAVPSVGAAILASPTLLSSGGISLLNDALERITGDDYDDPKVQAEKKNWFYDPAARGSIEWTNSVNDFFDSWKYKASDKGQEKLDVTDFWATANPNNVAANIGNGVGSVLGFIGTVLATKKLGGGSGKVFQGLGQASKAEVLGSYMYMNNEVYNEFRNNAKIDDLTAAKLSSLVSLPIALSEYVGLSALGKVMTKPMVKNAIKGGVEDALASYGTKGLTKELYQDFTAKAIQGIGNRMTTAALKGAEGAVIEGVQEYGQGKMQQAAEALYDKIANEKVFGTELFNKQALKDDVNNAFWGGAIGGLLGMGGGMINSKEMQESVFHYVGINLQKNRPAKIDGVKKFITQLGENGKITPEQTEQGIKMVDEMVAIHKEAMPLMLKDIDARYQAYEFIQARNKIQADLLALDEKPVDPTLAKADSELRTIMEQSAEAYDEAIALIAKTKGQISESELGKKLFEIGTQFNKVEAPAEEVKTDITPIENTEELTTETKVDEVKVETPKQEEVKVDLAKNDEMLKKAEKALKATITKIEQLKTQPLGAKESQAARDEKIANFEERKKQIETKIGELNNIREAETRVEGIEETGAVVETADTGVSAEEVVEKQIDYNTPIQVNVDVDEKGILSDTKLGIVNKIKEAIAPLGVKYKKVVASNKGNRYFVVTKDDKMFEIGRLVANEGKPFPLKLNNKEWVEHAKSIEKTIKEKENKQEVQQKEKAAKLASEYVGESVYYKGKKGVIEKEGEKYVITTDETIYEFNENDFSLEDEKVVLANKKEESKKTYKVDVVDEKTAIVDGFEYSIVYDKKGNAVALTSKTRTIRTEQALIDTDIQIAKLPTTAAEYEVINEQLVSEGYAFNEIEAVDNMLAQNMTDRIANLLDNGFEGVEDIDLLQLELFIENAVKSIDKNFSGLQYAEDIKTQLIEIQKIADNEYDNRFKEKSTESNQETATSKVKVNPDEVVEEVRVKPDVNEVGQDVQEDVKVNGEETALSKLEKEYNSKTTDELIKIKKQLYGDVDIETPMSEEEKLLDKVIAKKFSDVNAEIIKKRKEKKVETDEEKNIKKDIASLEKKLSNAKGKKEASGIKKQIIERKKMLNAAQKGEAYVAEQKVNKDYKRGVPKAVKDFVAADTYGMALQYFGSGGRVSRQSFEDATGLFKTEAKEKGAGRKIVKGNEEYDASRSMFSEKAPDYTDVANELTDYQGGEIYDEMVLAMEEVMRMRKADINAEIRRNVEKMQYGGLTKEQADKIEQEEIENAKAEQALINEYEDILAMEQEYLQSQQIGFNERDLNEKIAEAKKELRLSEQAYDERKAQLGRELVNEQPALFEEVKEGMDRGDVNLSQENIDKILMPFKARVETAKRNLEKIDNEEQRNQAKDLDKRQTIIKFEQDIKNAAMEEGDIVDNMDENGDIKQDCQ